MEAWELALAFVGSFVAGYLGSMLGLVLGTLRLPLLVAIIGSPLAAAGTNIAISAASAGAGAVRHHRERRIDWHVVAWMAPPSIIGAIAGALLADDVSERVLYGAIAAVLLWSGVDLALRPVRPRPRARLRLWPAVASGLGIGALGRRRLRAPGGPLARSRGGGERTDTLGPPAPTIPLMATTEDRGSLDATRAWREELYGRTPERQGELFSTISGVENEPLATPDTVELDYERDLGYPGVYPFTRGVYPSMYRGKLWTMRQFAGFGTAAETNERFRYLLEHGQTGLSTAFDMPTLMGYDSDHERSLGEVGREGVAIDSLDDMETLFTGIPLGEVSTSMTINSAAPILLAFYVAVAEQQGVPATELRGTIQTDILKEYIAQKEYIFPPEPSLRLVTDMVEYCAAELPKWHPISISGYHIREAGSTAAQELAFTLADGFTYVEWAIERGMDVDEFAPRLSFFFNAHLDFFEEIAKYRAARRIWARELRERFGARDPRSWLMRFHTQTAGVSLTAQQPEVNIVRTAVEALAAVLGGTQSLHTNSFDEALALPTEDAVRLALRTQQVIAHETGVVNTIDPLGGSYFVEDLTNKIEAQAYEYFERIDELGGMVEAIKQNFPQQEIADAAFRYQGEVERGERIVVGVNRYVLEDEQPLEILKIDAALEAQQIERVRALKSRRDSALVQARLAELKRASARDGVNLMPAILDAARDYVTMGEMCDAWREVWGTWRETPVF
ncbi:MAG: methylmalonyl-CoA mutase family protein [Gaiellaceae bacterium MAG52_C11]|nr:methylmalonyl-CoA mutase family protein [Candidatus Gaiellasilicea maunaloa]